MICHHETNIVHYLQRISGFTVIKKFNFCRRVSIALYGREYKECHPLWKAEICFSSWYHLSITACSFHWSLPLIQAQRITTVRTGFLWIPLMNGSARRNYKLGLRKSLSQFFGEGKSLSLSLNCESPGRWEEAAWSMLLLLSNENPPWANGDLLSWGRLFHKLKVLGKHPSSLFH